MPNILNPNPSRKCLLRRIRDSKNRDKINSAQRAYRDKTREHAKRQGRKYYAIHKHKNLLKQKQNRQALRAEFFDVYGWVCAGSALGSCPENVSDPIVLTIGHRNHDGKEHRKRAKCQSNIPIIRDLRRRGWPKNEGIETQCMNCQLRDRFAFNEGLI